jgi:LPS sulfotransferase NodH
MRVLILGTPRSGSTSLVRLIDSHMNLFNYRMFIEPFNQLLDKEINSIIPLLEYDNILLKNLFLVGNAEYPTDSFIDVFEYLNWCYTYFDKIIVLDRRDRIAQSESFVINETMWREKGVGWHTKKIYDLDRIDKVYLETMIDRYTQSGKILNDIAYTNNFPIFYYEDIFLNHNMKIVKKLFEYLGMDLDMGMYNKYVISNELQVRIDKNKQNLI